MGRPGTWCHTCQKVRSVTQLGAQAFKGCAHCSMCAPEKHGQRGRKRPHLTVLNAKWNADSKHQAVAAASAKRGPVVKHITKAVLKQRRAVRRKNAERRRTARLQPASHYLVRGARPKLSEVNALACARVAAAGGRAPSDDPVLREFLFCSPLRDQDATTAAVRSAQRKLHALKNTVLSRAVLLWLHVRAWRCFGTQLFVEELGVLDFKTLRHYKEACAGAALRLWCRGFHAFQNAYGKNGFTVEWHTERKHWRLKDQEKARCLQAQYLRAYWEDKAHDAWDKTPRVQAALAARDWVTLNKAVLCRGAGPFSALQLAKDLLDAPGWPQLSAASCARLEEWYPVAACPGTLRGLCKVYGRQLRKEEYLQRLLETRDRLNDDREARSLPLPPWTLCSTAHWLCEVDKYVRARKGTGRPPRLRNRNRTVPNLGGAGGDSRDHPLEALL